MWWKKTTGLSLPAIFCTIAAMWPAPQHVSGPPLWWGTRCKLPRRYHRLSAPHNDDPLPEKSALSLQSSVVQALLEHFLLSSLRLSEYFSDLFDPGLTFWLPRENRTGSGSSDLKHSLSNAIKWTIKIKCVALCCVIKLHILKWSFIVASLMVRSSHVGYIIFTSWIHMNATIKSLLRVGNSKFSVSPEFLWRGRVSEKTCRMQWTQPETENMQQRCLN